MGKKQKMEERERKKERLNDGNNNGQATHGPRKPPGPKQEEDNVKVSAPLFCTVDMLKKNFFLDPHAKRHLLVPKH